MRVSCKVLLIYFVFILVPIYLLAYVAISAERKNAIDTAWIAAIGAGSIAFAGGSLLKILSLDE